MPDAPNTSASWSSVPFIWSVTTNGTSVSQGPQTANKLTKPANRPSLIHATERTYRTPSRTSSQISVRSPSARVSRADMSQMQRAETANVSASTMNAYPVPAPCTTNAPTIGPITIMQSGRTVCPSEFASTSNSSGTIWGMIELKAGPKIACPAP